MIRIPIAVISLLLLASLNGCALLYRDLVEPTVQLVSIAPQQVGFSGIRLLCRLRIENPNDVKIPIRGGNFGLAVEGVQVAQGALIDGFTVAARDSEIVDVVVDVDTARSLALAMRLLGGGEQAIDYALTGYIDVAIALLGRVRIDESGSVPLNGAAASRRAGDAI